MPRRNKSGQFVKGKKHRKARSGKRRAYKSARHTARRTKRRAVRPAAVHTPKRRRSRARAHRRSRRRGRSHNVVASKGTTVIVRRVGRGKVRRARRHSGRRVRSIRVNPGIAGALGVKGFMTNVKATTSQGIKGFALAAGGAAGAVFAGSILQGFTTPIIARIAPAIVSNMWGARVLAGANFLISGALLAKFATKNPRAKQALLVGSVVAAILEIVKPGLIRENLAKIPGVGAAFSKPLSDIEGELSDYVEGVLGDSRHGVDLADYQNIPLGDMSLSDYENIPLNDVGAMSLSGMSLSGPVGCGSNDVY